MKVSNLIDELITLKELHGDIDVRLQCDHGQELMTASRAGVSYINDDSYMPTVSDEIDDDCDIRVIEIQAF